MGLLQPLQQNYLIPNRFQLIFSRIANTVFYCTHVAVPGLSISEATQNTPHTDLYVPGNKIHWGALEVSFIVDADFNSWFAVYNWLIGIGKPDNYQQYANLTANATINGVNTTGIRPPYSDAQLIIYTSKNNPQLQFTFADCFPVEIGPVPLDYGRSADDVISCSATFRYTTYQFNPV